MKTYLSKIIEAGCGGISCNTSTWVVKAEKLLIRSQLGIHSETLS
jgi:hypothetical protein